MPPKPIKLTASSRLDPGLILRFTYNHAVIDEATGDRYKEVMVLNPNFGGMMHAIDMKRLTQAEREVLTAIFDPASKGKHHHLALVNDVLRRMDPIEEVKNPMSFYQKFVKVFLKNKDAYRKYEHGRIINATIVKESAVIGGVTNPTPVFHKVESKAQDKNRLDLIKKVAAEKGVGVSPKAGEPLFKKK